MMRDSNYYPFASGELQRAVCLFGKLVSEYNINVSEVRNKVTAFRGTDHVRSKIIINWATFEQVFTCITTTGLVSLPLSVIYVTNCTKVMTVYYLPEWVSKF